MPKDLAIVLNSGSIPSCVVSAIAAQRYRLIMLHAEIGQGARMRAAYDQQVAHFKPYREHSLPMPFLTPIMETKSTTAAMVSDPRANVTLLGPQLLELLPLISAGVRYATHYQAAAIYLGFRVGSSGDELAAATEYTQIWNELIQMPCGVKDLDVLMPLLEMEPYQIVDLAFQVAAPLDRTWSCLEESSEPCWACPGCKAREKSFQQAGKIDPLRVVKKS